MRSEVQTGSERASVAVLEGQLQPPGNTPRRRNCGTGKEARKIDHVHAIGQIRGLNLQGRTPLLLAVDFEPCSSVQRKVRFHSSSRQIHFVQYLGAKLSQQQTWVSTRVSAGNPLPYSPPRASHKCRVACNRRRARSEERRVGKECKCRRAAER